MSKWIQVITLFSLVFLFYILIHFFKSKSLVPKFNRDICTTRLNENKERVEVEEEQKEFLFAAISICEKLICLPEVFFKYTKSFKVRPSGFIEHLSQVNVVLADWNQACYQFKDLDKEEVGLSWLNRCEKHQLFINSIFWLRYSSPATDKHEKQRIVFQVAACILHELAHLALQWTSGRTK